MKTKFGKFDFRSGQEKYNEGLVIGLLLGTAIGACAAVLLAPKSGKSLRKRIKEEADRKAGDLGKRWDKLKDHADDAADEAKDQLDAAGKEAKSKLNL